MNKSYKLFLFRLYRWPSLRCRVRMLGCANRFAQNIRKISLSLFSTEHVTRKHKYFSKTLRNISGAYARDCFSKIFFEKSAH